MRSASLLTFVMVLVAGTVAIAVACPAEKTSAVLPQDKAMGSVTSSYPAGIGAGPVPKLVDLTGTDFDRGYIQTMYQHHTDIAVLTGRGIEQATDKNLQDISGKIRYEQTKQNQKLALWHREMGFGKIPVVLDRPEFDFNRLADLTGAQFDYAYAQTLVNYLQQAHDAAVLGQARLTRPEIRDTAQIVAESTQNEINALNRWLVEHPTGATAYVPMPMPSSTVPAGVGTGAADVEVVSPPPSGTTHCP